jgi:HTH-type transcriptional regulator / antitoxin MqsA
VNKSNTQPCPVCGSKMRFEKRDDVLSYQGKEKRIKTLGWWCTSCDEAIFDGKALAEREKAFLTLKAEVDHVLGPEEVTKVREKLRLSQRRAGMLLGGGPRAFQKYESGKQAVSVPMSHLLRLLEKDPKRLHEIVERAAVVAKKTVAVATQPAAKQKISTAPSRANRKPGRSSSASKAA